MLTLKEGLYFRAYENGLSYFNKLFTKIYKYTEMIGHIEAHSWICTCAQGTCQCFSASFVIPSTVRAVRVSLYSHLDRQRWWYCVIQMRCIYNLWPIIFYDFQFETGRLEINIMVSWMSDILSFYREWDVRKSVKTFRLRIFFNFHRQFGGFLSPSFSSKDTGKK